MISVLTQNSEVAIEAIVGRVQEKFKASYLRAGIKNVLKITTDEGWIKKYGKNEFNIAGLDFKELPTDWKVERITGAKIALQALYTAIKDGKKLDNNFIEKSAEMLHVKWLERNAQRATKIHKLPYMQLPEDQKAKDRFFIEAAIEIYQGK